jgi:hypothetical protein
MKILPRSIYYNLNYKRKKLIIYILVTWILIYVITKSFKSEKPKTKKIKSLNIKEFQNSDCYSAFQSFNFNINLTNKETHVNCDDKDWILINDDGTLIYNTEYLKKNNIQIKTCEYAAIKWYKNDFEYEIKEAVQFVNNDKININEEFFQISCKSFNKYYKSAFARIFKAKKINKPLRQPINVFLFGLDSVARETWLTYLPESSEFLIKNLSSNILNGYNIVGDGTPAALIPVIL